MSSWSIPCHMQYTFIEIVRPYDCQVDSMPESQFLTFHLIILSEMFFFSHHILPESVLHQHFSLSLHHFTGSWYIWPYIVVVMNTELIISTLLLRLHSSESLLANTSSSQYLITILLPPFNNWGKLRNMGDVEWWKEYSYEVLWRRHVG